MELKSLLHEALKDRFKAEAVVEAAKELITSKVEKDITQKYKDVTLFKGGMEFELFAVKAICWTDFPNFDGSIVRVNLHYTCKSKLPKNKAERLEQIKKNYDHYCSSLGDWSSYKHPITYTLRYELTVGDAISGSINLKLEI